MSKVLGKRGPVCPGKDWGLPLSMESFKANYSIMCWVSLRDIPGSPLFFAQVISGDNSVLPKDGGDFRPPVHKDFLRHMKHLREIIS